jgi:competence ComEA-like helix-hairpin-helix protein
MSIKYSHSYLYFTRKERRGSLALLSVVLLICFVPFLYPFLFHNNISEENKFDSALFSLKTKQAEFVQKKFSQKQEDDYRPYDHASASSYSSKIKGTLFYFDPNTISADDWKKLGLRDKTIATILNFRSKGGRFRQPEDIKKIWGLFPDEAERLIPYIQLAAPASGSTTYKNYQSSVSESKKNLSAVEINGADTTAFIALPGIGSKLSQRIINFRDKLGGFYSIDQVKETFGLPDSVYQKIKPMLQIKGEVKKININTATLDELKIHPYIKYQIANALVQYRQQHGLYKTIEDLKSIMLVNEEVYNKIAPYLKVE